MSLNLVELFRQSQFLLSVLAGDRERVPALPEAVMHKRFILLLSVFLGSYVPTAAQTPATQIVPAQERVAPNMTMVRMVPAPLIAPSFPLSESSGKSAAHFSYLFVGAYARDQSLESLSPMREVKTLFLTQSSLPLVQLWGGRLRLDGFTSRLHMQNVQLGPSAAGGLMDFRPQRQGYPSVTRSVVLYGVSLSLHLERDAQIACPARIWRYLARIAGHVAPP
jgi:hypothetical protein